MMTGEGLNDTYRIEKWQQGAGIGSEGMAAARVTEAASRGDREFTFKDWGL